VTVHDPRPACRGDSPGDRSLVDPRDHREDVVRRLLARGLTPATLHALFPTWDDLISRLHAEAPTTRSPLPPPP
jgi:hypothetical protein